MYRFVYQYNALKEVQCWLGLRLSRGTAGSALGHVYMPPDKVHYNRESRAAWYLDMQHRLARLNAQERRILMLSALGHTQLCIGQQIGYSLRTTVRLFGLAAAALEQLEKTDRERRPQRHWHPSEAEVDQWMLEPRCLCWSKLPGRPARNPAGVRLAARWQGEHYESHA